MRISFIDAKGGQIDMGEDHYFEMGVSLRGVDILLKGNVHLGGYNDPIIF